MEMKIATTTISYSGVIDDGSFMGMLSNGVQAYVESQLRTFTGNEIKTVQGSINGKIWVKQFKLYPPKVWKPVIKRYEKP